MADSAKDTTRPRQRKNTMDSIRRFRALALQLEKTQAIAAGQEKAGETVKAVNCNSNGLKPLDY